MFVDKFRLAQRSTFLESGEWWELSSYMSVDKIWHNELEQVAEEMAAIHAEDLKLGTNRLTQSSGYSVWQPFCFVAVSFEVASDYRSRDTVWLD